jgi:hypothetical protein
MPDRTIERILAEWRAAEAERQDSLFNPELEARIEAPPQKHAAERTLQDAANELREGERRGRPRG